RIVSGSWAPASRIWDVGMSNLVNGHAGVVQAVGFSPDGNRIVSASRNEQHALYVWDSATGESIGGPLHGDSETITCVAFSPDGRRVISGSWDKTLRIWDIHPG
ncbi:WD40 repeat-like protein, partial [Punctularia strigosozonata HHB-11173 SS5]|uniref:WD40 repeat-like protein n=1 Tax=Punctularia strigosozonata (strain HHB-11173) TaxID=741275 RepID=UPI0004417001